MPKILLVRFSSIGDIVLTTPVIRCLKLQLPAEIHFLTKQSYHSILAANPYLSKIYTIQKKVSEVLPALKEERYDYVVDLHKNLRSAQVKFALSAQSFSFDKLNWQKWLLVNFKINQLPAVHIVDRYLATVESLGVKNDGAGLDYFIPDNAALADSFPLPVSFDSKIIVFAIGAAHQTKRLPTAKITEICTALLADDCLKASSYSIALIGGPAEQTEGELIAQQFPNRVINYCGKISLNQSALLISKAEVVITHDTGMMHIAAALKRKIVSIWGSTVPEFGMYPYYPTVRIEPLPGEHWEEPHHHIIENKPLPCRPCSKIGHAACPKGHFNCMQQIDPLTVAATVRRLTKLD